MKAERRHELQRNTLEIEFSRAVGFFRKRGTVVLWSCLGVALAIFIIVTLVKRAHEKAVSIQSQVSRLMAPSMSEEQLQGLEAAAEETSYPRWAGAAQVGIGDQHFIQMMMQWKTLGEADRASLRDKAEAAYRKAVERFPQEDLVVAKAHYGLGKLAETEGDLARAQEEYQAVIQRKSLVGQPIVLLANAALEQMPIYRGKVYMPASAPSQPATAEATTAPGEEPTTRASRPVAITTTRPAATASAPADSN